MYLNELFTGCRGGVANTAFQHAVSPASASACTSRLTKPGLTISLIASALAAT
jgi:hypothetical protein